MKVFLKSTFMVFLICVFCGNAQIALAADLVTQKHILDNGLTVLVSEVPQSSSVSVYGLIQTGSATEGKYLGAGLSHFMEHMIFKGTERRGVGEIAKEVQSLGGTINASTHFEYTIYTLTVPKEHFEQAADILSDMLMNAKFDSDEIERERQVIFNEMRMHDDRPARYLSQKIFETVYKRHPYRIPVIGFEDLLKPLTRDDFLAYYKTHYQPNNMVVSVAGDIESGHAFDVIKKFFGHYPRGTYAIRNLPQEPDQLSERRFEENYATKLLRMSICYQGIGVMDDDLVALDALAMILGQGQNSRLYQSLREDKKLVHSISASNFTPYDRGLFEIEITTEKDNVEEILTAVDSEIQALIGHGVSADELERIVSSTLKSRYLNQLTSPGVAYRTAVDQAITQKYDFTKWYLSAFADLTSDDIVSAAKKYLRHDRRSVVAIKPKDMLLSNAVLEEQKDAQQPIEVVTLDNGLRVLLRQDTSVPLVWMDLLVPGGIYADPPQLQGLSNFTSELWIKGSKHFSKKEIAELTAQKGIGLSSFSGSQSFGIRLNFLNRDLAFCFKMLSDFILNPSFTSKTFDDHKQRVQTKIISRNDSIAHVASMMLHQELFKGHPLSQEIVGEPETVAQMKRDDIVHFYEKTVNPREAVLTVFGDFNRKTLLDLLNRYFKTWKNSDIKPAEQPFPSQELSHPVQRTHYMDKEQAVVTFGFQAESFYHSDRYGLELLGAIIGSPFKGRMFEVIRDQKGLAYTLGGGYTPAKDTGYLAFRVLTKPDQVSQVKETFEALIINLQKNGVTQEALDDMKAYLIGRQERSIDTSGGLSFQAGLDELYGLGYTRYQDYQELIRDVSADDIQRLAQKYLDLDKMAAVTILPENAAESGKKE